MKAKRKVHLSGKWWHPTREFEFYSDRNIDKVVSLIEYVYQLDYDSWKDNQTKLGSPEVYYEFLMHRTITQRGMSAFIKSSVQQFGEDTRLCGKAGIGNQWMFKVLFVTHVLLVSLLFILLINTRLPEALFCLVFPLGYTWLYVKNARKRDKFFNDFLESVLVGKIKNEHDISATPVNTEN